MNTDDSLLTQLEQQKEYLNTRFTGKQKVQMIIDKIKEKREELIIGNTIELRSLDFHYNFNPDHQEQVLKLLQDEHNCIKYKITRIGESIHEIEAEKVEMARFIEGEYELVQSLDSEAIREKAANAKRFSIEILPNFDAATANLGLDKEIAYRLHRSSDGTIFINNIALSKPHSGSPQDEFIKLALENAGNFVASTSIQGQGLSKLINGFKIKGILRDLFFEIDLEKGFTCYSMITYGEIHRRGIQREQIEQALSELR